MGMTRRKNGDVMPIAILGSLWYTDIADGSTAT